MNIVVVGCDCTGKSTTIEKLSELTGFEVIKGSSFELTHGKTNEELFNIMVDLAEKDNVIFDRFAHCNNVYAPLYDDYAQLSVEQIREIESHLPEDSIIIHLTASKEVILERFETRGEEYVDEGRVTPILEGYEKVLDEVSVSMFSFDTGIISTEDIINLIGFYHGIDKY